MELRMRAAEARREAARLEALARSARDRMVDPARDQRAIEQRLLGRAAEVGQQAGVLEAAGRWRPSRR